MSRLGMTLPSPELQKYKGSNTCSYKCWAECPLPKNLKRVVCNIQSFQLMKHISTHSQLNIVN